MISREQRIEYPMLKEGYIKEVFNKGIKVTTEYNILDNDGDAFVKDCYNFFFQREVETAGLEANRALMEAGMSKEGMLYYFYISEEFQHRFELKNLKFYKREYLKFYWDVNNILSYDGWKFVEKCFEEILNRKPKQGELNQYIKLLCEGMPKEGIIYLFATSEEGKNAKAIARVQEYQKIYEDYIEYICNSGIKNRIKNIIERMTGTRKNSEEIKFLLMMNQMQIDKLSEELECLDEKIQMYTEGINDGIRELYRQMGEMNG